MCVFAKETKFDVHGPGRKSARDSTLIKILKSQGLNVSGSALPKTKFLPSVLD